MKSIDNTADMIDSRIIPQRIAELQGQDDRDIVEQDELDSLVALGASSDYCWEYGGTLIRDSYFRDYAQDLAEDTGAIGRRLRWPLGCIDWEAATQQLQVDYVAVDFDGVTYWY